MTLRLLDLFSGIGGFSYAAERLVGGYETVQFVEREPFCQSILRKHWPDVPIHDDVCTYESAAGAVDVICGGFPCQDISTAGKQTSIKKGTRSGLFFKFMRIIRMVRPRFVIMENVAAILANPMLGTVLGELAEAGMDAEWACIPASAVGACHQRDRWWLVAHPTRMLGNGSTSEQCWQSGGRSVPESGDGDPEISATNSSGNQRKELSAGLANTSEKGKGPRLPLVQPRPPHHQNDTGGRNEPVWLHRGSALNPDWRAFVSKPIICRGDDGVSGRIHRLKALGNAVVPQVAAIPLKRVLELASK